MSSNLVLHRGGRIRTLAELATIATPDRTDTWTPVPHYDLVGSLLDELRSRDIQITSSRFATAGKGDAKLFGVMDLHVPGIDHADYATSIGLRGSNDKSIAIQIVAAAHVFVCDNMAFSGSDGAVVLSRKHTSRLSLADVVPPAVDGYLEKAGAFALDIERMKDAPVSDGRAKRLIYDALTRQAPVLPVRLLPDVHRLYFDDDVQREKHDIGSLWSLNNAFTEAVKKLSPSGQDRHGLAIGRYFARALHSARKDRVALPTVAWTDGQNGEMVREAIDPEVN